MSCHKTKSSDANLARCTTLDYNNDGNLSISDCIYVCGNNVSIFGETFYFLLYHIKIYYLCRWSVKLRKAHTHTPDILWLQGLQDLFHHLDFSPGDGCQVHPESYGSIHWKPLFHLLPSYDTRQWVPLKRPFCSVQSPSTKCSITECSQVEYTYRSNCKRSLRITKHETKNWC